MRYLLTGGAGFIGSHLAEKLLREKHRVHVIDDLSTGNINNISHLKTYETFSYTIDTVFNRSLMAELVDSADVIFHLAAAVGVRLIVESPVRTIETNIGGTEIVLEMSEKKQKPVIIFSTSEVYGKSSAGVFSENGDLTLGSTVKSRWCYAASKIIDEFLALAYYKERKLPVTIVRLFNTVGPRQTGRYGMVLPRFVQQALSEQPITVYGDGRQTRTFVHVNDVVWALSKLVQNVKSTGEVFNIGGNEEISIIGLAERVKGLLCSSSPIEIIPYAKAYEDGFEDMMRRVPDISKISSRIGFSPVTSLDDIVMSIAEFYRRNQ